jgi:hypothetical protein
VSDLPNAIFQPEHYASFQPHMPHTFSTNVNYIKIPTNEQCISAASIAEDICLSIDMIQHILPSSTSLPNLRHLTTQESYRSATPHDPIQFSRMIVLIWNHDRPNNIHLNFLHTIYAKATHPEEYGILQREWRPTLLETRIHGLNHFYQQILPMSQNATNYTSKANNTTTYSSVTKSATTSTPIPPVASHLPTITNEATVQRLTELESIQTDLSSKVNQILSLLTNLTQLKNP